MSRIATVFVFTLALALLPLQSRGAETLPDGSRPAVCRKIIERYKALLQKDPEAPFRKGDYADSPFNILADMPGSGVEIVPGSVLEHFNEDPRRAMITWGERQEPPVDFATSELDEIAQLADARADVGIDRLPDTPLFRVSSVQGTLGCYASKLFIVKDARAILVPGAWSEENGESCGVSRVFANIWTTPVAVEENYEIGGANFASTLSVHGWDGAKFALYCSINFVFEPRFLPMTTFNQWDQSCSETNCKTLRRAAFRLVESTRAIPADAQKSLIAKQALIERLTASQPAAFTAMEKIVAPADSSERDGTELAPLLLPLLFEDKLYLARISQEAIGWRNFSDVDVTIEARDKDDLKVIARFAIGVTKGTLIGAEVK